MTWDGKKFEDRKFLRAQGVVPEPSVDDEHSLRSSFPPAASTEFQPLITDCQAEQATNI
jgi:hypothetical protein